MVGTRVDIDCGLVAGSNLTRCAYPFISPYYPAQVRRRLLGNQDRSRSPV